MWVLLAHGTEVHHQAALKSWWWHHGLCTQHHGRGRGGGVEPVLRVASDVDVGSLGLTLGFKRRVLRSWLGS
jgi:hypothetical protein